MKAALQLCAVLALGWACVVKAQGAMNQLTSSEVGESAQRQLFTSNGLQGTFVLPVNSLGGHAMIDNPAGVLYQADISAFPFLATQPRQGSSGYIAALKPCGLLGLHSHPRGNEQYVIISGVMTGGIAQEVTAPQNLTYSIYPGQTMVVPQGMIHYNSNKECEPCVFVITYDSADPGLVAVSNAITGLKGVDPESIDSMGFQGVNQTALAPFALDSTCLSRCNLPASGGDLSSLSTELKGFLGQQGYASPPATYGPTPILPTPPSTPTTAPSSG